MKTTIPFVLSLLFVTSFPCFGVNYSITFTGSGASTTVESVIVQNLTRSTSVTILAGNTLDLSVVATAVAQMRTDDETIRVYPDLIEGKFTLSIYSKHAGSTQIDAFNVDGRKITGITSKLQTGVNLFQLSLPNGSYAIQVVGNGYTYTAKIINQGATLSKPEIVFAGYQKQIFASPQKSKSEVTTMLYSEGDCLLFKGISGNYSTILTDVPTGSKNIIFSFIDCTDTDGNHYPVVQIGTQVWMAENLKTTKFIDGTAIPLVSDNTVLWGMLSTPAYCWYGNDATIYKNIYGALYNWYTVNTSKLAPIGWHIPTYTEWISFHYYLINNGFNYDGTRSGPKYAKSISSTSNWITNTGLGSPGNDLTKNNSTGFSALPGGVRESYGVFNDNSVSCALWSSSLDNNAFPIYWYLSTSNCNVNWGSSSKNSGFSVRCVRD